ncbi:MAG TPA: Fe-S-binding domain-containing protein [Balneola sp.]|jgi:NADH-quinone oxidoreductase subunit M|nr:Fe-S-binding domain-containing protein [Balneola sp.]MAO79018.1 Fe-S-binding domain-containing protein [Balneola sp.]MBF63677.1 Fe-S-binding domain-containing protein [Balneola sp.]HAH50539.1 Fe-S-binding domain-containing protein [Balneola sp.]HBZ38916.1 Fe-S-binding domain-containing protein [Balneola sp.]|tara:strand:+ start:21884 stop:23500 length:1617 start_codon:yes stop_codon:yes gene_type:complete
METLLNITIYLPLLGIPLILLSKNENMKKWSALLVTSATFLISLPLMFNFDVVNSGAAQYLTEGGRISSTLDIKYLVGLDGLSLLLFMLTTFMGPIVIISSWNSVAKHLSGYLAMLLLLQTASLGVFASLDLLVFYVFFELSLIPMYFLIGIWGGSDRIRATLKFFIYTLVGSLIMLVGLIYVGYDAGSVMSGVNFTLDWRFLSSDIYQIGLVEQTYLFLAFALAFCIKVPLFPFHTWLPYAHTEAPTAGSVVLAAIMLKMGTYGLIRVCLPLFPNAFMEFAPYMATLAVIGIIYGALVAMVQKDVKKLVAYSSVSHLGFVVLGIFALNTVAVQGAIIQMVNHGLSTGALFLIVGMIYDRRHTRMIKDFGGIAKKMPIFTVMFMIATLASIGLPGLNGFVGEFLILNGSFFSELYDNKVFAILAASGVILAAVYMLWMFQRVMFGPLENEENKKLVDLNAREIGLLVPLVIFMFWIGIHPVNFTKYSENQVTELIITSKEKSLAVLETSKTEDLPEWANSFYGVDEETESESLMVSTK